MDLWLEMLGAMMDLDSAGKENLYMPVTGSCNLLTGCGCSDHTGHNHFEFWEGQSPGLFVLVPESEAMFLLVCPVAHNCAQYTTSVIKNIVYWLHIEEITTPA